MDWGLGVRAEGRNASGHVYSTSSQPYDSHLEVSSNSFGVGVLRVQVVEDFLVLAILVAHPTVRVGELLGRVDKLGRVRAVVGTGGISSAEDCEVFVSESEWVNEWEWERVSD